MATNNPINRETRSLTVKADSAVGIELEPFGTDPGETTELRFNELGSSNYTGFKSPDNLAVNVMYRLPSSDGTPNQVLGTDGDGNLTWLDANAAMTLNSLSDVAIIAPQAGHLIYSPDGDLFRNDTRSNIGVQEFDANTSITDEAETRSANIDMDVNEIEKADIQSFSEHVESVVAASTTSLNLNEGNVFNMSQDTNIDTFNFNNAPTGVHYLFTLIRTKDATGDPRTISWPASVKWDGGTEPTLTQTSEAVDVLTFRTIDGGTTWYGFANKNLS